MIQSSALPNDALTQFSYTIVPPRAKMHHTIRIRININTSTIRHQPRLLRLHKRLPRARYDRYLPRRARYLHIIAVSIMQDCSESTNSAL